MCIKSINYCIRRFLDELKFQTLLFSKNIARNDPANDQKPLVSTQNVYFLFLSLYKNN